MFVSRTPAKDVFSDTTRDQMELIIKTTFTNRTLLLPPKSSGDTKDVIIYREFRFLMEYRVDSSGQNIQYPEKIYKESILIPGFIQKGFFWQETLGRTFDI